MQNQVPSIHLGRSTRHLAAGSNAPLRIALDENELATRWGLSVKTLRRWRQESLGPVFCKLGARVTTAMRLGEPCEVIYVPLADDNGGSQAVHYLVVRFAGDQVTAVQMVNRNRKSFCYFPARDATLVYSPERKVVEVYAYTLSTRAPLAGLRTDVGTPDPPRHPGGVGCSTGAIGQG